MKRLGIPTLGGGTLRSRVLLCCAVAFMSACASGGSGGPQSGFDRPDDNEHTRTAEFLLLQERPEEALESAMLAIAQDSLNPLGYDLAGRSKVLLMEYAAADSLFKIAEEIYPPMKESLDDYRENAWINAFNASLPFQESDDGEEVIRLLEMGELIYPAERPEALWTLGGWYVNEGRYDESVDAFGTALEIMRGVDPATSDSVHAGWRAQIPAVLLRRARILLVAERPEEAVTDYRAYLEQNPTSIEALSGLASALVSSGQSEEAEAIYDDLLEDPELANSTVMDIGVGLYQVEVFDQAARAFARVAAVAPEARDALYNQAQSLHEYASALDAAEPEGGQETWNELILVAAPLLELDPHNPNVFQVMAAALVKTGQSGRAVELLEHARDLPFAIVDGVISRGSGETQVTAVLENRSLEAESVVEVNVHFIAEDGAEIGSAVKVSVEVPDPGTAVEFQATLESSEAVLGFYFDAKSPSAPEGSR